MISDKQRRMLAFIEDFVRQNGYPPTIEEIRSGLDISSKSLVKHHLAALEKAALLRCSPQTPRGIRLVRTVRVPMAAEPTGPAGALTPQAVIELTADLVPGGGDLLAWRVPDSAAVDALLHAGDILIMQPQQEARNGELVAARLLEQNRTTFRRYYRENGHVRLQPENPAAAALVVRPEAVEVQGKVVAVIRQVD